MLALCIVYGMLSFGFSHHKTKSADLSSEDSTQCVKDLLLQKLTLNQYGDEGQNHNCEEAINQSCPAILDFLF